MKGSLRAYNQVHSCNVRRIEYLDTVKAKHKSINDTYVNERQIIPFINQTVHVDMKYGDDCGYDLQN